MPVARGFADYLKSAALHLPRRALPGTVLRADNDQLRRYGSDRSHSARSVCPDQAGGLLRGQVTGRFRAELHQESEDGVTGQPTEKYINLTTVIFQKAQ